MPVEAIGASLTTQSEASLRSTLDQDDFIRLFLAQLQFQDPLEPLDNAEFLAQMAQFSGLEQTRITNDSIQNLVFMNSTAQAASLLQREVEVVSEAGPVVGTVTAVEFTQTGPQLTVATEDDVLTGVAMSQVRLLRAGDSSGT